MSARIIGICGSPRQKESRTNQLVQHLLTGALSAGAQTEFVDVTTLNLEFCDGCDACHLTGKCKHTDDFDGLFDKMLAADGIVLGSPVYIFSVSAQLKVLLDRLGQAIHCQRLLGKYGAAVTTAGGMGHLETADFMENVMQLCGVQTVGSVAVQLDPGMLTADSPEMKDAHALGVRLVETIANRAEFPDQLAKQAGMRGYFGSVIQACETVWAWEHEYWREQGWLQ